MDVTRCDGNRATARVIMRSDFVARVRIPQNPSFNERIPPPIFPLPWPTKPTRNPSLASRAESPRTSFDGKHDVSGNLALDGRHGRLRVSVTDHSGVRITVAMDVGKAVAVKVEKLGGSDVGGCEWGPLCADFFGGSIETFEMSREFEQEDET